MTFVQVVLVVAVGWFMSEVVRAVAEELWDRSMH